MPTGIEPYRPSNGTEGLGFYENWCNRCERDRKYRETGNGADGCSIIAATMLHDIGEPEYPKEWIEDGDGPKCTSFAKMQEMPR